MFVFFDVSGLSENIQKYSFQMECSHSFRITNKLKKKKKKF